MKNLNLNDGVYFYKNKTTKHERGLDLTNWLSRELTNMSVPHTNLCCPDTEVNVTAAITAAELATGRLTSTSAAAVTATLPTATLLANELRADAGSRFQFLVDNSAGANTVTIAVNTGITVGTAPITGGGTLTVSVANAIGLFELFFTSTTAAILRRIA